MGTGGDAVDAPTPPDEVKSPSGQRREDTEKTGMGRGERGKYVVADDGEKIGVVKKIRG